MTIGDRIKELREERKITQEELAKYINTTKQTIHKYENNIVTNIPSDKIEKLSEIFSVSPAFLMGWTTSQKEEVKISPLYEALEKLDIKEEELTEEEVSNIVNFINFMRSNKK
ncbi:helix-turn-helix domain-containing protein [Anaerocolumna chitinilytica]|uniref:DNA-binding phage protein n=1 Tax=Anaerocolumna chitinilytica TaxID=1727145 RepID=A0A7M3SAN0_9FIRM|nr:helix-turn-helix transcriptional regulator [Anaerocolumna chitinilytica]BCK01648.1 DNA-binding phage protein [Anaerocolumna chitinilytica]